MSEPLQRKICSRFPVHMCTSMHGTDYTYKMKIPHFSHNQAANSKRPKVVLDSPIILVYTKGSAQCTSIQYKLRRQTVQIAIKAELHEGITTGGTKLSIFISNLCIKSSAQEMPKICENHENNCCFVPFRKNDVYQFLKFFQHRQPNKTLIYYSLPYPKPAGNVNEIIATEMRKLSAAYVSCVQTNSIAP